MLRSALFLIGISGAIMSVAACTATQGTSGFGGGGSDSVGTGNANGGAPTTTSSTGSEDITVGIGGSSSSGTETPDCDAAPDEDKDGDGFTINDGDCNDCDKNANPGAVEVKVTEPDENGNIPAPADEDCDGDIDNVQQPCDDNLSLSDVDPWDGAKALELCKKADAGDKMWGVLDAKYVGAGGGQSKAPALQVGLIKKFGTNVVPEKGKAMLGLSTGHMRTPGQPGACLAQSCDNGQQAGKPSAKPANFPFPQNVPGCQVAKDYYNDIALELKMRAPTNATGYKFEFKFQSFEFAEWVCSQFNDQFIALVSPAPKGSINGNISFDSKKNPVSVNIAFFDVCDPAGIDTFASFCSGTCPTAPMPYCPLGKGDLNGTGFNEWGDGGATSWLQTTAPVTGGEEFTIRFAIWDASDPNLDSSVLIDNFDWIASGAVEVGTAPPPK